MLKIRNLTRSFGLCISILLLAGCQSTSSLPPVAVETPSESLESSSISFVITPLTLTSSEKQMLRTQSRKVLSAGTFLTIINNLTTNAIAAPLQKVCLTGATELNVNGTLYPLKETPINSTFPYDATFAGLPKNSPAKTCTVSPEDAYTFNVSITARGGWTATNGRYPLNDPENLVDTEQARNGKSLSLNLFKIALMVFYEGNSIGNQQVVDVLQPKCLSGFKSVVISGVTYDYALLPSSISIASCKIEAVGGNFQVTVKTANGLTYINGSYIE
jgi:hypothetical protein